MVWLTLVLLLQAPSGAAPAPEAPAGTTRANTWTGCVQAGTAPSTYRLNLDEGTAAVAPDAKGLGGPFLQLVGDAEKLDLTRFVGKHVTVTGRELPPDEAAREAASRPDQQEAAETAAGTGGRPQRHFRYVRVEKIAAAPGECR